MSHTKEAHFILSADLSSFFLSKQDVIATLYLQKLATAATTNLRKRPKVYYFHCSLHIITLGAHTHISFLSSCNAARASRKWMQKEAAGYGGCGRPMFPQRNVWSFNKKVECQYILSRIFHCECTAFKCACNICIKATKMIPWDHDIFFAYLS